MDLLPDFLRGLLREGGPIMPLIIVTGLAGYAVAAERLIVWVGWLRRDRALMRAMDPAALRSALAEATHVPKGGATPKLTPFAWVLQFAVLQFAEASSSLPKAQREAAIQARLLACMPQVGTRIASLGWLGGILPMLGLMGTVSGMILTFRSLAATSSRQVLSLGLAEALYATLAGLLGALPLLAAHHVLTRFKARWLLHLERCLTLLEQEDAPASKPSGKSASKSRTRGRRRET